MDHVAGDQGETDRLANRHHHDRRVRLVTDDADVVVRVLVAVLVAELPLPLEAVDLDADALL
jgi:hypothetical protein